MSTLLYGALSRARVKTRLGTRLNTSYVGRPRNIRVEEDIILAEVEVKPSPGEETGGEIKRWQDALVALIPAEVLAVHAVVMQVGTTTEEDATGKSTTTINHPADMRLLFGVMAGLAVLVYFAGSRSSTWGDVFRSLLPAAAFAAWAMLMPFSSFDAFTWDPSRELRIGIAAAAAVAIAAAASALAKKAEDSS